MNLHDTLLAARVQLRGGIRAMLDDLEDQDRRIVELEEEIRILNEELRAIHESEE